MGIFVLQILKSYELVVEVEPMYHPKLIGRRGEVINKIRTDHDVKIQLPDRNDENQSRIVIVGYEKSCEAAKDEILKMVREYVSFCFYVNYYDKTCHHSSVARSAGILMWNF